MKPVTIKQIVQIVGGRIQNQCADLSAQVKAVTIDSRMADDHQLFVALRGETFDGHEFVLSAVEKGAVGVIAEHPVQLPDDSRAAIIVVDNSIEALGKLAAWYRQQISAKVIAITGSAGKTTVRQIMHQVLSGFYRCRQAPKSFNNHIGVPLAILSAEADDEILLLELGSNHPGEISELTKMSKPDIAVVTFIGPAHLEGFGTLENVLKEKASIAEGLSGDGTLYINGDQPELVDYVKTRFDVKTVLFGTLDRCDVIGTKFQTQGSGGSLLIDDQFVKVPLAGKANLMNILTVWSVCKDIKVLLSDFVGITGRLMPVSMRLEVQELSALTVLNDCYNANPASMANALECLKTFSNQEKRRLVFIAGDMYELGGQSQGLHIELGQKAAAEGVQVLLCVGRFAADMAGGAVGDLSTVQAQVFENVDQLCDNLHKYIQPDDIILVKGSRAVGLEKAVQRLRQLSGSQKFLPKTGPIKQ